jgi:hypothetical protein
VIFCTTSRYRICIAEEEFRIYEVSFINFADYTSAFAEIIMASEVLFWMAADWRFFCTSGGRMTSALRIGYL